MSSTKSKTLNLTEPRPAFVDPQTGEHWWRFAFEYRFEDDFYSFDIVARDREEALERHKAIAFARYVGQLSGEPIPASIPGGGIWIRFKVWWLNKFGGT